MFSFEITPLANIFFVLTLIVFFSLFVVKNKNKDIVLHSILLVSLGFIFYADNFITFFIGWEMMSWSSYFIISLTANKQTLQKYIAFNIAAGFSLLGAIIVIYGFCGTFIYSQIDFSLVPPVYTMIVSVLFLVAIFIKSGVVPFHHWVVDSYNESNHIFTTILSAVISKVGIFTFLLVFTQITTIEYSEPILFDIIAWAGVITSIIATFKAINQDDMKKLLAYSSIAQVGYIITIMAIVGDESSSSAITATLYYTIVHTFVKLLLFVNIAAIIYVTNQMKFSNLGALLYKYPINFVLLVIGIIALAGMPPLGGFSGKFLIYTTLLQEKQALLLVAVMFSSASAFLYCYKLVYGIYLGQSTNAKDTQYKKIPFSFYIPQFISAFVVVLLGIFPSIIIPWINQILLSLNFEKLKFLSISNLYTPIASFNGFIVMVVFVILFIVILAIFISLKNKTKKVKNRYDISYCAEVPKENVNLHYGYSMGYELKKISFIKTILENSSTILWDKIKISTTHSASVIKNLYGLGVQNIIILFILFFTIILFIKVGL